ncbi:MAG: DUF1667 domain-containing protein [Bacilli bacterium]
MSKIKLICTSCPRGCHLEVDENLNVTGNHCPRGIAYARDEITNPRRYIATTVMINSTHIRRLSVATKTPISKALIFPLMDLLKTVKVEVPVHVGDTIVHNVLDSGVDIVATKTILE